MIGRTPLLIGGTTGRPYGLDLGAALQLGQALGYNRAFLAEVLPPAADAVAQALAEHGGED